MLIILLLNYNIFVTDIICVSFSFLLLLEAQWGSVTQEHGSKTENWLIFLVHQILLIKCQSLQKSHNHNFNFSFEDFNGCATLFFLNLDLKWTSLQQQQQQ